MTERYSNFRRIIKKMFNLRKMVDYDNVAIFTQYIVRLIKTYFVPGAIEPTSTTSFDDACRQFGLSKAELVAKQKNLLRLSLCMLLLSCAFLAYSIYHMVNGTLLAFFPSLTLAVVSLALAFRYHFWYFQIKQRKLGCTFNEWLGHHTKDKK